MVFNENYSVAVATAATTITTATAAYGVVAWANMFLYFGCLMPLFSKADVVILANLYCFPFILIEMTAYGSYFNKY